MSSLLAWIIPPISGAIIGYITNAVAIKMLFRPYQQKKVFGKIPIPFTPGILPKQRYELSKNIADLVERELLSPDVVQHRLDTPEVQAAFAKILMDNFAENFPFAFEPLCNSLARKILSYISGKTPQILDTLDITKIVKEKIDSLVMEDIERMVMQVTRSQLRWINVFGGMLGALIGIIQPLLNMLNAW